MTIIAAINSDADTLIGYNDGSELDGSPVQGTFCPWIFFGDWAFGISGASSVQRFLDYELKNNFLTTDCAEDIISEVSKILLKNYFGSKKDDEYVTTFGIYGILIFRDGRIWDVSGCLSLTEIPKGKFWARGSGADYAIGANYAIVKTHSEMSTKDRLLLSVEAAIENDIYSVGGPIVKYLSDILTPSREVSG